MDNPEPQRCGWRFASLFRTPAVNRLHIDPRAPNTNPISPSALPGGLVQQRVSRLRARVQGLRRDVVPAQARYTPFRYTLYPTYTATATNK